MTFAGGRNGGHAFEIHRRFLLRFLRRIARCDDRFFPLRKFGGIRLDFVKLLPHRLHLRAEFRILSNSLGIIVKVVDRHPAIPRLIDSRLDEVVEERGQRVVVLGGNRIVFVIVAFRAAGGRADPDGSQSPDMLALERVQRLFLDHARLAVGFHRAGCRRRR